MAVISGRWCDGEAINNLDASWCIDDNVDGDDGDAKNRDFCDANCSRSFCCCDCKF